MAQVIKEKSFNPFKLLVLLDGPIYCGRLSFEGIIIHRWSLEADNEEDAWLEALASCQAFLRDRAAEVGGNIVKREYFGDFSLRLEGNVGSLHRGQLIRLFSVDSWDDLRKQAAEYLRKAWQELDPFGRSLAKGTDGLSFFDYQVWPAEGESEGDFKERMLRWGEEVHEAFDRSIAGGVAKNEILNFPTGESIVYGGTPDKVIELHPFNVMVEGDQIELVYNGLVICCGPVEAIGEMLVQLGEYLKNHKTIDAMFRAQELEALELRASDLEAELEEVREKMKGL
jgi:hypothetical protein